MNGTITSPLKAIRVKCLECSNESDTEVKMCPCWDCPLYAFRFGKNPYRTPRALSEEQKAEMTARLHRRPDSKI